MAIAVIVCGYGKVKSRDIVEYLKFALKKALKYDIGLIIPTGGDTADDKNGHWLTEAEMLKQISKDILAEWYPRNCRIELLEENEAYNTLTNILYSLKIAENKELGKFGKVFIVCNRMHFGKILMASIKLFGLKETHRRVSINTFPLTKRVGENLKILVKTIPESIGYFIRPIGRRIEYWQWKQRTGRNENLNFCQFCARYIPTGELL